VTGLLAAPLIAGAIGLPHVLRLERAAPPAAIAIWLAALLLRALVSVTVVVLIVVWFPATEPFERLTGWCWHAVLPFVVAHLHLNGHRLGDLSTLVPALVVSLSVAWVVWGVVRAARAVRCLIRWGGLGPGPRGSLLIGGAEAMLAVAGLWRPRVVVSAGALAVLDDSELAAGMAHEKGHIARSHRYLLLVGMVCGGLARFIPGTQQALNELAFSLERDADHYALAHRHDRLSLASAICKTASAPASPALHALGTGPRVTGRVRLLLSDDSSAETGKLRRHSPHLLAVAMTSLTLAALVASPMVLIAQAETPGFSTGAAPPHCQS
jgi:Zn-dependent protease with chaperone function